MPTAEDTSNPVIGQRSVQPRRLFRCESCSVKCLGYGSLVDHRKNCANRLKLPQSSTIASRMMMNLSPVSTDMLLGDTEDPRIRPCVEALNSALVRKTSALDASIKTALEARNVISVHKKVQRVKERTRQELEEATSKVSALTPDASAEEWRIVYDARSCAASRAKTAVMDEKYAAETVEHVLHKQKAAFESAVEAITEELSAFFEALKAINKQGSETSMASMFQNQNASLSHFETDLAHLRCIVGTLERVSLLRRATVSVPTGGTSVREGCSVGGSSETLMEQRNGTSIAPTSGIRKGPLCRKCLLAQMNSNAAAPDESKTASVSETLPQRIPIHVNRSEDLLQPEVECSSAAASEDKNISSTCDNQQLRLPPAGLQSPEMNAVASCENSAPPTPEVEQEGLPHGFLQPEELMDANAATRDQNGITSSPSIEQESLLQGSPGHEQIKD